MGTLAMLKDYWMCGIGPGDAAFNAVYAEYFVSKPARSCVAVREIPKGCLCEIEAIAVK